MMQAMVDPVTGMVYWVPVADHQSVTAPIAPLVMQAPYRLLHPVLPPPSQVLPPGSFPQEPNTTVFVRGIPREATTQSVESFFQIYGEILSCHVIRHKDASTNKGIAFVKFRDAGAAQRAISCNHPGVMEQREVFAEWAHPRPLPAATSGAQVVPDHQIVVGTAGSAPHVFLQSQAPRFLPLGAAAHQQPWIVGAQYLSAAAAGGQVLGFPAHAGFSGHENFGFSNYFPGAEYYAPAVNVSASSPGAGSSTRNERDGEEADREGHVDPSHCSITQDSERSTKSRKGKEKET